MEKPKQLKEIDVTKLREKCQEYIDFLDNDEEYFEDNSYEDEIHEIAMETFYGKDVWKFINNRQD